MDTCPNCPATPSWASDTCLACGCQLGPPNIREVKPEQAALLLRYQGALAACSAKGIDVLASDFANAVGGKSQAVINGTPSFFASFFSDAHALYSSYALQTSAETRAAADMRDDKKRRAVESALFGAYAPHIRYATLSLNGLGLVSYGCCSMVLNESLCKNKATLLETNSFTFIARHGIDAIPVATRAIWEDRHLLATAKLADKLQSGITAADFPALLLETSGDRHTDEFIEVHIYGPFGCQAVVAASMPKTGLVKKDNYALSQLNDILKNRNIPCKRL